MSNAHKIKSRKTLPRPLRMPLRFLRRVTWSWLGDRPKRTTTWVASDGCAFIGRACHMRCLKHERLLREAV